MPDQTQLLALDRHLTTAIADLERAHPRPHRHGGTEVPAHAPLVTSPALVRIASTRMLVWIAWLRHWVPTEASVKKALHRLRGAQLYAAALAAQQHGTPLPVKPGHRPPAWALQRPPAPTRAAHYTPKNDPNDPIDWWDAYGDFSPLEDPNEVDISQLDWLEAQVMADMAESFAFADWLTTQGTTEAVLSDYQVMQLLESYWNGQAALFSGKQFGEAAGIAGSFDMSDPKIAWFLRAQAGNFLSKMEQSTRQQLANVLADAYEAGTYLDGMTRDVAAVLQNAMSTLDAAAIAKSLQRAEMIAITETARAQTFGTMISMLEAGVQRKIWQVTSGACIYCEENQEQGDISITDTFPTGDQAPPAHPKCRCSVASWRPDTFDPNQWAYRPNPDALLSAYFENPDVLANWPAVEMPEMNVPPEDLPPLAQRYPDLGLLQFSDLPQGLQDVLTPDALDSLTEDLGSAVTATVSDLAAGQAELAPSSFDDFMSRFAGLQEAFKTLEQAQVPPTTPLDILPEVLAQLPTEVVPQQDIEAALEQTQEYTDAEQQMIDRMRSNLDDILADFRSSLDETGDETGE